MTTYRVLSTKKLQPALVTEAQQRGVAITQQEFISIRTFGKEEIKKKLEPLFFGEHHFVFTSANAVKALEDFSPWGFGGHDRKWKIFCLSGRTREQVAITFPEATIVQTAENAASLAQQILSSGIREVVFFCGNQRRDELPQLLNAAGIKVQEEIVYETVEVHSMPEDKYDGILFFSPSAVNSFFSVNHLPPQTVCFAIGLTTASAIADYTDNKIITSEGTSQEMMMATVLFYFQNINCYE